MWCCICLWLSTSSGEARPLLSVHYHADSHSFQNHILHTPQCVENTPNAALFLNIAPDVFSEICEETEESETEDALESDHITARIPIETLDLSSVLASSSLRRRTVIALYILHHNWKHFLA